MKRFFSLVGFFLFFFSFVNAQNGKMSGKITESGTGNSVSNISVKISALNRSTVSDQEGFFEIKNIPFGKYTVTISSGNFETYETNIDLNAEFVAETENQKK